MHPVSHPSHADFSPAGDLLAVKDTSGEIVVLAADSLEVLAQHDGRPWGEGAEVIFSPCGAYLVDGSWNGDLVVREAISGHVVWHERGNGLGRVTCTPDRMTWVHDGFGGITIRAWPFGPDVRTLRWPDVVVDTFAIDASARRIGVRTWEGVEIWDVSVDSEQPERLSVLDGVLREDGTGHAAAWSPPGEHIAFAGSGAVRVFSADLGVVRTVPLRRLSRGVFSLGRTPCVWRVEQGVRNPRR